MATLQELMAMSGGLSNQGGAEMAPPPDISKMWTPQLSKGLTGGISPQVGQLKGMGKPLASPLTSGQKIGGFSKQGFKSGAFGSTADMIGSSTGLTANAANKNSTTTNNINTSYDMISDAAMNIPGGQLVGGAMKLAGLASDGLTAMGIGTDQKTTTDKILDSKFLKLSPVGLINAKFAKGTLKSDEVSNALKESTGFEGVQSNINNAGKSAGKYGLFSQRARKAADSKIKAANALNANVTTSILASKEAEKMKQSNAESNLLGQQLSQSGMNANKFGKTYLAKDGMKLKRKEIQEKLKPKSPKNVIPSGALHAHKHHLEEVEEAFIDLTEKGIPLISIEDGEVIQHAEVEHSEIILHKELTEKLEKLWKDGSDAAKIEAGKILAEEIILNTEDNTNKILSDENGILIAKDGAKLPSIPKYEERTPYQSELDYFKNNTHVGGMATEDGKIIINPYSTLNDEQKNAVRQNESIRLYLRGTEIPFSLTDEQKLKFKDYSKNDNDIKSTLIGRYLSGDNSAGNLTEEQLEYIKTIPAFKKGGKWLQKAVNPEHKGFCTPITKETCTPRRKAFAMTMKKHHGFHKIKKHQQGGLFADYTPYVDKVYDIPKLKALKNLKTPNLPPNKDYTDGTQVKKALFEKVKMHPIQLPDILKDDISTKDGRIKKMYKDLTKKGLSREKAIAVLANIDVETGGTFAADTSQVGGGPGYGLVQMEKGSSRYQDLVEKTGDPSNFDKQWDYILDSITGESQFNSLHHWGGYGKQDEFIKGDDNDIKSLTEKFGKLYLRPGKPHWDKRIQSAEQLNKIL